MMPCSTPTPTTTAAVIAATQNSSLRSRQISRMFAMSTSLRPIRKTTAERTAFGRYCSGFVRKSRTIATTTAVVSCATCVRLFASSTISVFVGLPLTTNVLLSPAARLDARQADEVVVLDEALLVLDGVGPRGRGALREDHEEHRRGRREQRRSRRSSRRRSGSRCAGRPLGTGPRIETP